MPRDRELQFAAMSVIQSYVKSFAPRMKLAVVKPTGQPLDDTEFVLQYSLDMPSEDLDFFYRAGVRFDQPPQADTVVNPSLLLDFSDDVVLPIAKTTNKHVCQVYGMLCGIADLPFPAIPVVKPRLAVNGDGIWGILPGVVLNEPFGGGKVRKIDCMTLLDAQDGDLTGVVGPAGPETYLSCSKGIPTIEILPPGRGRNWLSKWANPMYRAISHDGAQRDLQLYAEQARHNLELICIYLDAKT